MVDASRRLSLWAIASLVCSMLVCPPMCVLGVVLGVVALVEIPRRGLGGRRLAIAGVVVGLACSAGWGAGAVWWHVNVRTPLLAGPAAPLRAGLGGDVATFRSAFVAPASEEDTARFLARVQARHGALLSAEPREPADAGPSRPPELAAIAVSYVFRFERGPADVDAVFVARIPGAGWPLAWDTLTIRDAGGEDLVYPVPTLKVPVDDRR